MGGLLTSLSSVERPVAERVRGATLPLELIGDRTPVAAGVVNLA